MCLIIPRNSSNVCLPGAPPISVHMPGCVWRRAELVPGHGMTGPSLHMSSPGPAVVPGVACMEFLCWKSVTVGSALSAGLVRLSRNLHPTPTTYILFTINFIQVFDQVTPSPVLNCPAERQQLNTERSARCPEPPPAAAGSQAQYQLQLSPQFKE